MSGTKAETQQCRVPVFDPDTLPRERGSGQARERGTVKSRNRENICFHVMAATHTRIHIKLLAEPFVESSITESCEAFSSSSLSF